MGIIKKQGGTSTILIYVGVLLGYVNAAVLLPKYFSPEVIGIRTLLIDYSTILLQFSLLGFHNVIQRYTPKFKNEEGKTPGFLFLALFIPSLFFICISLFFHWQEDNFSSYYIDNAKEFIDYLYLLYPLTFVLVLITLFETYVKNFYKIALPVFLKEVFLRLTFMVCIFIYVLGYITIEEFFQLFVATYYFNLLLLLLYTLYIGKLDLKPHFSLYSKEKMSDIFTYAGFTFLIGTTSLLVTKIDAFMIGSIQGTKEVGIYTIGAFVATLVEIPRRGIRQISLPLVSQLWSDKDFTALKNLHHKVSMAQITAGFYVFIAIVCNLNEIYTLIPNGEVYRSGIWVVVFISLARISEMAFGVNNEILLFSDKYKYNVFFSLLFGVLAISSNYYLIPLYGITGAAIASFGSMGIVNLTKFFFIKHVLKLSPFRKPSILLLLWVLFNLFIFNYLPTLNWNIYLVVLLKCAVFSLVYFTGIYFFRFLPEFNTIVNQQLLKVGIKGK